MSSLRIKFFGKPQIWLDGKQLEQLVSAKARATIYYLAATRAPASRELVAGLLWSDMQESAARANLRVVLSKLRSQLGSHILVTRREVALNPEFTLETDLNLFQTEQKELLRRAVELYTGRFLDDFYLRDAPLFEEWVEQERRKYHQKVTSYLGLLAAEEKAAGNLDLAIEDLRKLLRLEPWREQAHRDLMRVLVDAGQRGAALAQFEQCRQALAAELDVEPTAETIALYEQIKTGGMPEAQLKTKNKQVSELSPKPMRASPPNNLQQPPLGFVGRQKEAEQVIQQIVSDACRLMTITGPGGIGKTRLSIECAHQLLSHFKDGVFLVPLVAVSTAHLLPTTVATAIDLSLQGNRAPKDQLISHLAAKELLLIFDNFEHLLDGIDLLLDLIDAAPNLKLLVTSREPLGLDVEWVLPLEGLDYGDGLEQTSAQLFAQRAQRLDLSFVPEDEVADIGRICRLVEGMPLAIELASAWVRVISCHEIAAEIEGNLDFLATDLDLVPLHQRSIRAVFAYSWSLLPEEAQSGFARLAIFQGGFTRESAAQVAGVTLRTLTTLVDKSLVQRQMGGRYHIHPLLRQFGIEQLTEGERESVAADFAHYFATLLPRFEPAMYSSGDPDLLAMVQSELENIRAVWDWLTQNRSQEDLIQQLLPVTGYYFQRRNLYHEGLRLFEGLLAGAGDWQAESKAQTQVHAASFDCQLSHFDQGEKRLNEAIPILQQADLIEYAAEGFYFLGIIHLRKGDYPKATKRLNDGLALFSAIDDQKGCARVTNVIGIVASTEGRYKESEEYYQRSLDIHRAQGFQRGVGNLLSNLGSTYARQAEHQKAFRYYQDAAEVTKQVNETQSTAVVLSNLGSVSRALKRYNEGIDYYKESLQLTIEIGDQRWIAANYNGIGLIYVELEHYNEAISYLRRGFTTALTINALPDALTALVQLGRVALKVEKVKIAAQWLTFAVNQPETPAIARQDAEESLALMTQQLT